MRHIVPDRPPGTDIRDRRPTGSTSPTGPVVAIADTTYADVIISGKTHSANLPGIKLGSSFMVGSDCAWMSSGGADSGASTDRSFEITRSGANLAAQGRWRDEQLQRPRRPSLHRSHRSRFDASHRVRAHGDAHRPPVDAHRVAKVYTCDEGLALFPQIFGKYVLERPIAMGGMARVFLATLRGAGGFEKKLVVKQIRAELATDDAFVKRFVAEAKTTVELSHPNIVPVYELGVEQGVYYLAMELCDGVTLAELIQKTGQAHARRGRVRRDRDLPRARLRAPQGAHHSSRRHASQRDHRRRGRGSHHRLRNRRARLRRRQRGLRIARPHAPRANRGR